MSGDAASGSNGVAATARSSPSPQIILRADRRAPFAQAAQAGRCDTKLRTRKPEPIRKFVFALRADKPGRYVIKGVAVEYTVDGQRHRAIIRNGLGVCVTPPGEPTIRGCDAPRDL